MSALLFIQNKRKSWEKVEMLSVLRMANAESKQAEKQMERWARDAEIRLRFEE
jgi:hypothetical protein